MFKIRQQHLRAISRKFWGTLFTVIIAVAVIVQLAREAFPLLNDYRDHFARGLSESLGVDITIGEVSAEWSGMRPRIALNNLSILGRDGAPALYVRSAKAELSLLDSIANQTLSWHHLTFDHLSAYLDQSSKGEWSFAGVPIKQKNQEASFSVDDHIGHK